MVFRRTTWLSWAVLWHAHLRSRWRQIQAIWRHSSLCVLGTSSTTLSQRCPCERQRLQVHPCCSRSVPNVHVVTYPIAHLCWRKLAIYSISCPCLAICWQSSFHQETMDRMRELLSDGGGGLARHLFECYVHYLFEKGYDQPLDCRSLEGLHRSVL